MTDLSIGQAAYSVQAAKPSQKYGQLALMPVAQGASDVLTRFSLAGIPANATIVNAVVRFVQSGAVAAGTHSMTLSRVTGAWPSSVTWATIPAATATGAVTVSKTSPPADTIWDFNVTTLLQAMVTGTTPNIGFLLTKNQASRINLFGTTASSKKPILIVTYSLAPSAPSNLNPSVGAVSLAKPTLTFDADDDILKLNVQIDPTATPGTAWDSGDVDATAGLLDLSTTSYPGLANAATTAWRARQKNANGYGPWSSWMTFSRANKSAVTITSPSTGAITDGTPPIVWTFAGTQKSWQVRYLDASGKVIADSGRQIGAATSWTPKTGLTFNGSTGTIEVRIWDNVDRESTPGDPPYAVATLAVTLTLNAGITPVTDLAVTQDGVSPVVHLTGHRASVPDEMRVFVNGKQVARYARVDVFTGAAFTIPDLSAPMNIPATYRVAPVENGVVASGGNTVTYTPHCVGIWLFDESDHTAAVAIWTAEDQEQDQPEIAIEHTPISDGDDQVQVIRRRLVRFPPQGAIVGELLDALSVDVGDCEDNLRAWADYDAGHLFRLVLGNMNRTAIIGYLVFAEPALTSKVERILDVSFKWWSQV